MFGIGHSFGIGLGDFEESPIAGEGLGDVGDVRDVGSVGDVGDVGDVGSLVDSCSSKSLSSKRISPTSSSSCIAGSRICSRTIRICSGSFSKFFLLHSDCNGRGRVSAG